MKNIIWITAIFIAFFSGYFVHFKAEKNHITIVNAQESLSERVMDCPENNITSNKNLHIAGALIDKNITKVANKKPIVSVQAESSSADNKASQPIDQAEETSKQVNHPNEMSDEEIDKVLAKPFSVPLKKLHGIVKEKYKPFSEAEKQDEWDIRIQNKLTDLILSNVYSKYLNVDSIICKASLCEIRVIELKPMVMFAIASEILLQDWAEFGNSQIDTGLEGGGAYLLCFESNIYLKAKHEDFSIAYFFHVFFSLYFCSNRSAKRNSNFPKLWRIYGSLYGIQ